MGLISVYDAKKILNLELPELDMLVRENKLRLYTRTSGPHDRFSQDRYRELQTDGFYFIDSEIESFLQQHPENEWVSSLFARKYLEMSPAQFVDFLNRAEVETNLELSRQGWCANQGYNDYCPFFSTGNVDIDEMRVFKKSLYAYGENLKAAKRAAFLPPWDITPPAAQPPSPVSPRIAELESQVAELQSRLAAAESAPPEPAPSTTVNAELWENSCRAACAMLVEIIGNDERNMTREGFESRLKEASPGKRTHTKVDNVAWAALPDKNKAGPGRPKNE